MNRVYKYPLPAFNDHHVITIQMPCVATILTVQVQRGVPCLWALVDDEAPMEDRQFFVRGTGNPVPKNVGPYIGTFQVDGGNFVWHLWETPHAG